MAIRRNMGFPLAESKFDTDPPEKKKTKKSTTKTKDPRLSKLSPAEQKAMIQKIRALNAKGDTTQANKLREKLMRERKKGYYKR
jgi:hypothetical protein